jgi:MarR family transcriptional regulator for hemolysin
MVEPPTLAGILDRMQREGWIERRGCQDDRRRKHVCLQPGARRVWAQIVGCLKSLRCQASRGLSDEEVQLLEQLLRKVRANLSEPSAVASSLREQHVTGATS